MKFMPFEKKPLIDKKLLEEALSLGLTQKQMSERFNVPVSRVRDSMKASGLEFLGASHFNKGEGNPARRIEVSHKIAKTVKTIWENGGYDDRVNGMQGKKGWNSPSFKGYKGLYSDYLSNYQDITVCSECGNAEKKINIHHIDEDHENWLVTNLVPLCVRCHQKKHFAEYKQPYVTIGVTSHFDSSHNLLWYNGPCQRIHGHRYNYEVVITNRINPESGMVMDFKELKSILKEYIEEPLDHYYLNDILPFNPTAENMVVWMFEVLSKRALVKGIKKIRLWETPDCVCEVTDKQVLEILNSMRCDGFLPEDCDMEEC